MQSKSLPTYAWSDETQLGKGMGIKPRSPEVGLSEKEMCDYYPAMRGFLNNTFPLTYGVVCPECAEITGGEFEPHRRDVDSSSNSLIHKHLGRCQTTFRVSFEVEVWKSAVHHYADQQQMRNEMLRELELAEEYDRLVRVAHHPTVLAKQLDILVSAIKAEELPSPYPEFSLRNIHEALVDAISIENGFNPLEVIDGDTSYPTQIPYYRYDEGIDGPFKRDDSIAHSSRESLRERICSSVFRKYDPNNLGRPEDTKRWKRLWQVMQAYEIWADDRFGINLTEPIPDYSYILEKLGSVPSMSIPELDRFDRHKLRKALDGFVDRLEKAGKETV